MADEAVAKCFGCEHWFGLIATESVGTVTQGDVRIAQRWCVGCLRDIDANTRTIIAETSEYPLGTEPWEEVEPDAGEEPDPEEGD